MIPRFCAYFSTTIWPTLPYAAHQHIYGLPLDITIWLFDSWPRSAPYLCMNLRTHPNWVTRKSSFLASTISISYDLINLKGVDSHTVLFTISIWALNDLGVSGFRGIYFLLHCFKCTLNFIRFRCTMNLFLIKVEYMVKSRSTCFDHAATVTS